MSSHLRKTVIFKENSVHNHAKISLNSHHSPSRLNCITKEDVARNHDKNLHMFAYIKITEGSQYIRPIGQCWCCGVPFITKHLRLSSTRMPECCCITINQLHPDRSGQNVRSEISAFTKTEVYNNSSK